jgi:hypothetical protein
MHFSTLFSELSAASPNPLALVAYLCAVLAWAALRWKVDRNRNLLSKLSLIPEHDRAQVLRDEMGIDVVAGGLSPEQQLRSKIHLYYFLAFVVLCGVLIIVLAIYQYRPTVRPSSETIQKVQVVQSPEATQINERMKALENIKLQMSKSYMVLCPIQPQRKIGCELPGVGSIDESVNGRGPL